MIVFPNVPVNAQTNWLGGGRTEWTKKGLLLPPLLASLLFSRTLILALHALVRSSQSLVLCLLQGRCIFRAYISLVQLVSSFFIVCFKQYCPPMFLDSLTSTLTSNTPGSIITSTSHHESNTHVSSSNRSETGVITSSSGSAPDIISLD